MAVIELTKGKQAIVDDADYAWLNQWKWTFSNYKHTGYAYRQECKEGKLKKIFMHRLILKASFGMIVDHINGNGLDNHRCNLRLCTTSENLMNSRKKGGTSKYKGVMVVPSGRWAAQICLKGKSTYLGTFDNEELAAIAYNNAARIHFSEFALYNEVS